MGWLGRRDSHRADEQGPAGVEGNALAFGFGRRVAEAMITNGAQFLRLTHCPAAITEPIFGSNETDWRLAATQQSKFANGIDEWLDNL
jgi:hypothetical protein